MPIDGLIVLDASGRPLIQSSFQSCPPAYPLLHIDAYLSARSLASNSRPDPLLPVFTNDGPSACCSLCNGSLIFLCSIRGHDDPLTAFAFLRTLVRTLHIYLDDLSPQSIKDNHDSVSQIFEQMLDDGYPFITESNSLQDIVLPPSFLDKILSLSGVSGLSKATSAPFTSPIPWRRSAIRHNNNEIYFDLVENLDAVIAKNGSIITSAISGKIEVNSRLSGTPDLNLSFRNTQVIGQASLHSCVRIPQWERNKSLSFIPPDGRFTLLSYQQVRPVTPTNFDMNTVVPFTLKTSLECSGNTGFLEVILASRSRDRIERVSFDFYLGAGVAGASCIIGPASTWGFNPRSMELRWEVQTVAPGSTHSLKASFTTSEPRIKTGVSLISRFESPQRAFLSLKVDQLKMGGELYKPYKGVRESGKGVVEWRLV